MYMNAVAGPGNYHFRINLSLAQARYVADAPDTFRISVSRNAYTPTMLCLTIS